MCKRTTTVNAHVVKDHSNCEAAQNYTKILWSQADPWGKKETGVMPKKKCKPCRHRASAEAKARKRRARKSADEYRRAQGCFVM